MATDWLNAPWRKLYISMDAKWLSLPVSARGLGDELIKYGRIDDGFLGEIQQGEDAGTMIAYLLGARPLEHQRIADDVRALLKDGYLIERERSVFIRNLPKAQERRSGNAIRQQRHREKVKRDRDLFDRQPDDETDDRNGPVTGNRIETNRNETNRNEKTNPRADETVEQAWYRITKQLLGQGVMPMNGVGDFSIALGKQASARGVDDIEFLESLLTVYVKEYRVRFQAPKIPPLSPAGLLRNWEHVIRLMDGERHEVAEEKSSRRGTTPIAKVDFSKEEP